MALHKHFLLLQLCYKPRKPLYKQKPIVYDVYEHRTKASDLGLDTGPASHGVYAVEGQIAEVFKKPETKKTGGLRRKRTPEGSIKGSLKIAANPW